MRILPCLILTSIFNQGLGLKCWTCSQASTNEECIIEGSVKTCGPKEVCVNQETTNPDADGSARYQITKGCRQDSCVSNDRRNPGNYPTVCRQLGKASVCSCCCNTDLCNGPQVECKNMVTCRRPDKPGNGRIRCQKQIKYGSVCTVLCNRGYRRVGPHQIACTNGTNEGYWSPRQSAACVAISAQQPQRILRRCNKLMQYPEHGSMVCENRGQFKDRSVYNYLGTICAFTCNTGYFRVGSETTQCVNGGRWTVAAPACRKGMCQTPPQDPQRIDTCSDKNYVGTTCEVTCKPGYMLIGSSKISCRAINEFVRQGIWSSQFPRCVKAICRRQLTKPVNGGIVCTKQNMLGSVCTFKCRTGFQISDINSAVTCVQDENILMWKGKAPQCERLRCPRVEMPANGNVFCRGDPRRVGTRCVFRCRRGYDMVGNTKPTLASQCRPVESSSGFQEAKLTVETVECVQVRCQPERRAPQNGKVSCSRDNLQGSICIFSCDAGYDLDGTTKRTSTNVCNYDVAGDGNGKWSDDPPTCTRSYCPVRQSDLEHGTVKCTNESFMGSVCEFTCSEGYELVGASLVTCSDQAGDGDAEVEWSDKAPVCIPSACPELWYDKSKMKANCNMEKQKDGYPLGTKCNYQCADVRYYMENPDTDVTCLSKNKWSLPSAPRCFLKTCPRLSKIENGNAPMCSKGNLVSSICTFKCNSKYALSHKSSATCESSGTHEEIGQWDILPPTCVLNECSAVPTTPRRGKKYCSNGAKLGSTCTLECDHGYVPKTSKITCQMMTEPSGPIPEPRFQNEENFCCAECRSDFYITFAVDYRYKTGLQNVFDFTKIFLTQLLQRNNQIFFSAFAYGADVNQSTSVARSNIMDTENLRKVLDRIEDWQVEKEGIVSDPRSALKYANSKSFSSLDPNHANFLIIAAEDSPKNVDGELIQSMRARGIHIIIGVRNDFARIKWGMLLDGDGDVVNLDANEVTNRMNEVAYKDGCSTLAPECV